MASVQRCKNGTHSRQIQKKKAYGDISIRSMCLHHLHIYTPSTDKCCELLHTRQRTLDLKRKKNEKKKNQEGGTPSPTRPVQNKRRRMTVTWSISKANINFTFTQISH